jgi:hypothetical protein
MVSPPPAPILEASPNDYETEYLPSSILRKPIHSLAYRHSPTTLYASTLRLSNHRIALTSRHHDPISLSRLLPHGNPPSPFVYAPRFLYYYERDLSLLRSMVGSTPSNVSATRQHCISLYTCDLDAGHDLPLGIGHWLVTLKLILISYHLLTCHSFPRVYIQFSSLPWPRT